MATTAPEHEPDRLAPADAIVGTRFPPVYPGGYYGSRSDYDAELDQENYREAHEGDW